MGIEGLPNRSDAAARAMEASEGQYVLDRLAAGDSVRWTPTRCGEFWKFFAGDFVIVRWTELKNGRKVGQYRTAYRGVDPVAWIEGTVGTLPKAKRIAAEYARAVVALQRAGTVAK